MWKYQYTDELLYNSYTKYSNIYLGVDFSNEIKHWKYIKKEKKSNGKFRYYYDDGNELEKMEESISKFNEYSNKSYIKEQFDINRKKSEYYSKNEEIYNKYKNGRPILFGKKKYDRSIKELEELESNVKKAEKDYDNKIKQRDKYIKEGAEALKKYKKNKLGIQIRRFIGRGMSKVMEIFDIKNITRR